MSKKLSKTQKNHVLFFEGDRMINSMELSATVFQVPETDTSYYKLLQVKKRNIYVMEFLFYLPPIYMQQGKKWYSESADPAKAHGPSDILDRNPVVDISDC